MRVLSAKLGVLSAKIEINQRNWGPYQRKSRSISEKGTPISETRTTPITIKQIEALSEFWYD
ncbi:hypothetical protein [Salipaludibacillus aurantiacus]|uniref:hypothetical protein n=1 Tax=Salipaludibacillus aurantiacus TaxID=1601833 RepID=UPI0015A5B6B0|nr:hypothetical protein [Salipaludibacillus aurantiacus]